MLKSFLLFMCLLFSLPVWARPAVEDLAAFLSIRFNQAVVKQDLTHLFDASAFSKGQMQSARQFLQQNPVPVKELSALWSSSDGSVIILKYQNQVYRIDLSTLDQHKATINGRTIKASSNIQEIAKSIELAFPENRKRASMLFEISSAWAGIGDFFKSSVAALVFAGHEVENFGPDDLLEVVRYPHETEEWIIESFDCKKDGKISWTSLALSSKQRNGRIKTQSFSYQELPNPKHKTVLAVQGLNCETSPFYKEDGEWSPVTAFKNTDLVKACQAHSQSSENDCKIRIQRLEDNCKIQAQKYSLIQKCCAKAGCETAVKEKIENIKRSSAKDYNQIDPALRSVPGAK